MATSKSKADVVESSFNESPSQRRDEEQQHHHHHHHHHHQQQHPEDTNEFVKEEASDNEHNKNNEGFVTFSPWQLYYTGFLFDVLMYITVLNLAAEVMSTIIVDRFSISMFVAVSLKLLLDLIEWIEHKIQHYFCVTLRRKILGGFFMWLVVFSSKFLFLWADDVLFTDHVELGGFLSIIVLSVLLMVSTKLNRFVIQRIGIWDRKRMDQRRDSEEVEMTKEKSVEEPPF